MLIGKIKPDMNDYEIKWLIRTKRLQMKYMKTLGWLIFRLKLTEYKSLSVVITPYHRDFEQGTVSLGIDFYYRLKNVDHLGFDMNIKLIFFDIEIEFSDYRHIEDYKKDN